MSDKMECPGCGAYLSSVLADYRNGVRLRCCGLSWEAADQIRVIRSKKADEAVTAAAEAAVKRADLFESELVKARNKLAEIERVVKRSLEDFGPLSF